MFAVSGCHYIFFAAVCWGGLVAAPAQQVGEEGQQCGWSAAGQSGGSGGEGDKEKDRRDPGKPFPSPLCGRGRAASARFYTPQVQPPPFLSENNVVPSWGKSNTPITKAVSLQRCDL